MANTYLDDAYCSQHADVKHGQYVQIAVTDTGAGMPKGVVDRAFEPFFTTKPTGQGTGLGLNQVYGFVKQSGGHIQIYRESGEGTCVKIYLPRFAGTATDTAGARPEPARGRAGECVLVVEDDDDVRGYVVETLGALGYDVFEASSGDAALRVMNDHAAIQLLLTDVISPVSTGENSRNWPKRKSPD